MLIDHALAEQAFSCESFIATPSTLRSFRVSSPCPSPSAAQKPFSCLSPGQTPYFFLETLKVFYTFLDANRELDIWRYGQMELKRSSGTRQSNTWHYYVLWNNTFYVTFLLLCCVCTPDYCIFVIFTLVILAFECACIHMHTILHIFDCIRHWTKIPGDTC